MNKKLLITMAFIISLFAIFAIAEIGLQLVDKDITVSSEKKAEFDAMAISFSPTHWDNETNMTVKDYDSFPDYEVQQLDCNTEFCKPICINIKGIINDCKKDFLPYWINYTYDEPGFEIISEERVYFTDNELNTQVEDWYMEQLGRPLGRYRKQLADATKYDNVEGKVAGGTRSIKGEK